MIIIFHF